MSIIPRQQPSRTKRHHTRAITAIAVVLIGSAAQGSATPVGRPGSEAKYSLHVGDDIGWTQPGIYHEGLSVSARCFWARSQGFRAEIFRWASWGDRQP
jgi:hypothetical protein